MRDRKTLGAKRIGLVTGARIAESDRRKRNFKQGAEIHRREGSRVWIAPTLLFSDDDCQSYMKSYNLPRNPVKDNLCMSGECLCIAGDTLISIPNGWIEIANLEVGDVIHSSIEGCITPQPIYKVHCNDPKPMISLKAYFLPAIDITRNHPIYVRPYQHKTTKIEGVRTSRAQIDAPIYIEAGEIEQKFAQGKTQTVWNQQKFYVGYPFRTEEIPINLTDEQLRLLGYFMAEGAYNWRRDKYRNSKGGIIFTVSVKSETMALDIKLCIEKGLGLPTHWRDWVDDRTGRRFITVRNCGKRSSDWVSCFIDGRYCWEKSFNQSIMLAPVAMQSKILEAMWTGDGSEYTRHREGKTEKNSVYCTTSKVLALQVHEMLLRQGKVYGIRTTKPREKSTSSISAGFRHMYQVGRSNERTRYAFLEDGWLWATVQSVSESEIQQT
jgi:3'-phosphoadenosine 5'-phosphosulfate sulfotransferase (PAPS reductase)/FAD synthetase